MVFFERLLNEVGGTFFHRVHRHGYVAVAGDEDQWQRRAQFVETALQLQAGHTVHPDVNNQACQLAWVVAAQEGLGRIEAAYPVVFALKQPLQ